MKLDSLHMRRFWNDLGLTTKQHHSWTGQTFGQFCQANPDWTMGRWRELVRENIGIIKGEAE